MASKLIQIVYEEAQKTHCYPFADVYFNSGLTIYFENQVIADLVPGTTYEKVAICSWKLKQKLRYYVGRPRPITQELLDSDYEVMTFTRNTQFHNMFEAAELWHKGFISAFDRMLEIIGKKRPLKVKIPIYQNHHSTKTDIYQDYVATYLKPAMEAIENDENLRKMALSDSRYTSLTRESAEHLKDKIGMSYFPMAPFLLERLFSVYVANTGIQVTYL